MREDEGALGSAGPREARQRRARRTAPTRRPTMIDVANEARVSQTTVSLVLNHADGARLSAETRERVVRAASRLGYQQVRRGFASGSAAAASIGFICDEISTDPWTAIGLDGVRDVAIPPHIIPLIEDHLAKFVKPGRDSLLFPAFTESGNKHLQPATLGRHWYRAREKAGRKDLRWHDLRHSGAVLAAATGASLAELMARLGHSTPQAAMRYQHAAQGRDREIAALLSKLAANRQETS